MQYAARTAPQAPPFLPFDLDQFEYENATGKTRVEQLNSFRTLNEMARKVAALSGGLAGTSVRDQLDGWYGNTVKQATDKVEVFENQFNSAQVPTDWATSPAAATVYSSVVRRSCRGCHTASATLSFNTEAEFRQFATVAVTDLCGYKMPHALQTVREFWQSSQPTALEAYFRDSAIGQTAAADALHACGSANVATLDPQFISASSVIF